MKYAKNAIRMLSTTKSYARCIVAIWKATRNESQLDCTFVEKTTNIRIHSVEIRIRGLPLERSPVQRADFAGASRRMIIVQKELVLISGTLKMIISIDVDDDEYKAMTRATRTVCLEQNLQYNLELKIDVDDLYLIS
ncbi:hypothetical protein V1477_002992 [Vespula maculifrons]|uniref:Uncharacterized protein n=1 Tax=Vespula maculifrons TaxID=7453 RepID=A0ABD2CUJ5_VESMC